MASTSALLAVRDSKPAQQRLEGGWVCGLNQVEVEAGLHGAAAVIFLTPAGKRYDNESCHRKANCRDELRL